MSLRVFVPGDMCSVALGADEVAGALAIEAAKRSMSIEIVRNGSRGLFSIEPLVEVETAQGRIGYGPVFPEDVAALVAAGLFEGAPTPSASAGRKRCPSSPNRRA
jgi:formate dehydrogenase iron-sulfur subunit